MVPSSGGNFCGARTVITHMLTRIFTQVSTWSLVILFLTAVTFSRIMFIFIDDPEGPNLLIVIVLGVVLYAFALPVYLLNTRMREGKRIMGTIATQAVLIVLLYLLLY